MAGSQARRDGREIEARASGIFAGHVTRSVPSRSHSFRKASGASAYGFTVTWSPGLLCLTGDLGTLTLRHPNALARFEEGMEWLADADFEYLMGKAVPNSEQPDPEGTFERIVDDANVEAREILSAYREERATERRWCREDGEPVEPHPYDGMRADASVYAKWSLIASALETRGGHADADVRLPFERRRLRSSLARFLKDARPHQVSSLCRELGHDDWFGETRPDTSAHWQVAALRHAARHLMATPKPKPSLAGTLVALARKLIPARLAPSATDA